MLDLIYSASAIFAYYAEFIIFLGKLLTSFVFVAEVHSQVFHGTNNFSSVCLVI